MLRFYGPGSRHPGGSLGDSSSICCMQEWECHESSSNMRSGRYILEEKVKEATLQFCSRFEVGHRDIATRVSSSGKQSTGP